ncbi:hypothetical protein FPZ22_00030 [Luteimonas granuli]|uniref:Uncharacterized protein n=1 Tax=Luteimonas granuli TaxID=1176533 RepID=A0A518N0R0_9GAMM|nr:hypothetical protein FPZ22_00030 [Luteimonas granuli]
MIVARLARATLGARSKVDWLRSRTITTASSDLIARGSSTISTDFNARGARFPPLGSSNGARPALGHAQRQGGFVPAAVPVDDRIRPAPAARGEPGTASAQPVFPLANMCSHDQYNTTVYGLRRLVAASSASAGVLFIHREDIAALGIDRVDLEPCDDGVRRQAKRFAGEYAIARLPGGLPSETNRWCRCRAMPKSRARRPRSRSPWCFPIAPGSASAVAPARDISLRRCPIDA